MGVLQKFNIIGMVFFNYFAVIRLILPEGFRFVRFIVLAAASLYLAFVQARWYICFTQINSCAIQCAGLQRGLRGDGWPFNVTASRRLRWPDAQPDCSLVNGFSGTHNGWSLFWDCKTVRKFELILGRLRLGTCRHRSGSATVHVQCCAQKPRFRRLVL